MKVTVVYDNEVKQKELWAEWGFSALIENENEPLILFDTGADSPTLLHNMGELSIDPTNVEIIVISHAHWDHTGGLAEILERNRTAELYIPSSFTGSFPDRKVTIVSKEPVQISENVFSTGELENVEQSLALRTEQGIFVLTGCAHPSMKNILGAAARFGKVYGIMGGFHGLHDFKCFSELSVIYPCHCTQHKREILDLFKGKASECGAGLVLEL